MRLWTVGLVTCAALLAAASPAPASVRYSERSDQTLEARGVRALDVDNARGDVEVTPSTDGRIHVTALKTCRGRDRAEARRFAADLSVTSQAEGARRVLRVNYPRRVDVRVNLWDLLSGRDDAGDFGPSHEVRLRIEAPADLELNLHAVSGDLSTDGMAGVQRLRTTSGDCTVGSAGGRVDAGTVSGDIRLRGTGRALARTTSGELSATFAGPLDARSVSGDLTVESAVDTLTLASTSGDISARLAARLAAADLTSLSGDIVLALDSGSGASLDLSTASGDIDCDVPVTLTGHGRRFMNAKYGRGGAAVKARTVPGDLHVTSGGQ